MLTISYKPLTITNGNKYTYDSIQTFPKTTLPIICVVYIYLQFTFYNRFTLLFIRKLLSNFISTTRIDEIYDSNW